MYSVFFYQSFAGVQILYVSGLVQIIKVKVLASPSPVEDAHSYHVDQNRHGGVDDAVSKGIGILQMQEIRISIFVISTKCYQV